MKLYILGNGFDLSHNLHTKYSDFRKWLSCGDENMQFLKDELENMFPLSENWKNFEESLAYPIEQAEKRYVKFGYADIFVEALKKQFSHWVYHIKGSEEFKSMKKQFQFDENAFFITFNYTPVLESDVYGIDSKRVLHIHGYDIEHYFSSDKNLVMMIGHGNKAVTEGKSEIAKITYKDTDSIYNINKKFFNELNGLDEIIIIGFSYSLIDKLYFEKIKEKNMTAFWKFGVYSKDEKNNENCNRFIKELNISNYIKFNYDIDYR